jgi:hypothetical protein
LTQIGNRSVLGNNRERYEAVECVALLIEETIAEKKEKEYAIPCERLSLGDDAAPMRLPLGIPGTF